MTANAELIQNALRDKQFTQVRRRLFRQLLESLLYEGVLPARQEGTAGRHAVDGTDEHGNRVSYVFTAEHRFGFNRIRLGAEPVLRAVNGDTAEAESLTRFVAEMALGEDAAKSATFARELEETLIKDALAQHVRVQRGDVLAGSDFDTLECLITDGHPYHPAYKSRIGFDLDDNLLWGPEFARPLRPVWLAAHREVSTISSCGTLPPEFIRDQLGKSTVDQFLERIREYGADPDEYTLLPAHPWQWREQLSRSLAPELRALDLIVLGDDPAGHLPQQSIRTLACVDVPERAYLKVSLSIVNTSTSRVLAPHTVGNAPVISGWLRAVVAEDAYLRDELGLILLGEVMGISVQPRASSELTQADTYGTLACIWRESLHTHLEAGEHAVPFNGLIARELDGTPLIDPWVRSMGVSEWVEALLAVSVPPLIHLLQGHGIALESHAQNMALVHVDGRPGRLAVKDFHDGVRFSRDLLGRPDLCPELTGVPAHHVNRNSFIETDNVDLVVDYLLDAFLFINLGELAMFLDDSYDFGERAFWAVVRRTIVGYQQRFPELAERFEVLNVFKPQIEVEKLTTRRLLPDTELRLHSMPNPLAEVND